MRFDYHTHTPLCHHAVGEPSDYVRAAQAAGLEEIGFADHNPMPTQFDDWRMAPEDLPRYVEMIQATQKSFAPYPVRLGLECDFIPGYEDHIRWLSHQAPWDYLIGSVHYISPDWDVDNPKHMKRWEEYPVEAIWEAYFSAYAQMAASGLYDFLGHPDLVKKFGRFPEGDLMRFYKPALEALGDYRCVIELNTAGLRKDCREIYPTLSFLIEARKRGVRILINSDAHAPNEVGLNFEEARALAREAGYDRLTRFIQREAVETPL
ncbi:MAG: histidinol-phosphatase HisJ family protein [Methylacidiphilales bacterium]|nr:histidinol-phosphatase HisJ family protein [Candidatus Methylacidiphilales bacterium]MDW8349015.1 histidinol-phosphatase HisJ family protein [Verrucomicrobiae bacterium]